MAKFLYFQEAAMPVQSPSRRRTDSLSPFGTSSGAAADISADYLSGPGSPPKMPEDQLMTEEQKQEESDRRFRTFGQHSATPLGQPSGTEKEELSTDSDISESECSF